GEGDHAEQEREDEPPRLLGQIPEGEGVSHRCEYHDHRAWLLVNICTNSDSIGGQAPYWERPPVYGPRYFPPHPRVRTGPAGDGAFVPMGANGRRCAGGTLRRGGRRRGAGRGVGGLLAGGGRPPRRGLGEEALPPGEDLRRRPDAPGRPPTPRHGARRAAGGVPPLRRPPVHG